MHGEVYTYDNEILFLYDCKQCNPNGDPDNENKPRKDYLTERALVSDVRLKRYMRDYFLNQKGLNVFVSKVDGKTVDATQRIVLYLASLDPERENTEKLSPIQAKILKGEKLSKDDVKAILQHLDSGILLRDFIDIRLFGAVIPVKGEEGSSISYIGPVQFTWGYSLNKVELIETSSITSHFAGRTKSDSEQQGTIGKDWRLYYAIIAFYGRISGNGARRTLLSGEDVRLLDEALWMSLLTETCTRTKINQYPRFYLRIEYLTSGCFAGDLRSFIDIDRKEGLRDVSDYTLDIKNLTSVLLKKKDNIKNVYLKVDSNFKINGLSEFEKSFSDVIVHL